jgi:DNA (cytosine-5)-methyltransferase 1
MRCVPTVGSLFSGIGGLDLGLERAGWTVRWQVENDPFCQRVLAKHWPDVPRYGDIRTLTGDELERVDLIAGGFPCQPVSHAGNRLVQSDARWLWPEFARLIRVVRPRLMLAENVPGLLSAGFGDVLRGLAGMGFDAEWGVLSACSVGAPHVRRRVFIVADAHSFDGWPRVRHPAPQSDWSLSELDSATGPRLGWRARLENPSALYRGADGVPDWMDRNRGIGNAVVPQVAEWIGRRLLTALEGQPLTPPAGHGG